MQLIIGAMHAELAVAIQGFNATKVADPFCELYQSDQLLFCVTGIGFINAASCLTYVVNQYQITSIVNIGTCGAYNSLLHQGTWVNITSIYCLSGDFTAFQPVAGHTVKQPINYQTNQVFARLKLPNACLGSAADFVESRAWITDYNQRYKLTIDVIDMEGFAYAKQADVFKIPFSALKLVSDVIDGHENSCQFDEFIKIAGNQIFKMLKNLYN